MQPFDYVAPTSLAAATELLKSASSVPTRILAGGTDLLVQMRAGARSTSRVLDIKKIPETSVLEIGTSHLRIGAAISAAQICGHPELRKLFPGVVESIELIGSTQVQGRATPIGNLCNASPGADSVPALVAVGAEARVVSASGERWLPVAELPAAPGRTTLAPEEFVVELRLPLPAARSSDAYLRFTPRAEMDIAVVGVGVALTLDEQGVCRAARAAVGAVAATVLLAPTVADAIIGSKIDDESLARAAQAATRVGNPISDKRGTAEFRRHIAGVLAKRAIRAAAQRAQQQG